LNEKLSAGRTRKVRLSLQLLSRGISDAIEVAYVGYNKKAKLEAETSSAGTVALSYVRFLTSSCIEGLR
jgi:hypothetical protein